MKRLVVPAVLLAMALIVGGAMVWDCARLERDAKERLGLADAELRKHEERLVSLLAGSADVSPEVQAAIAARRDAGNVQERHAAYVELVASYRRTMSMEADPTNPIDRRFMDEIAGALNRREVAEAPYEAELAEHRRFSNDFCGRVARWFPPACCGPKRAS